MKGSAVLADGVIWREPGENRGYVTPAPARHLFEGQSPAARRLGRLWLAVNELTERLWPDYEVEVFRDVKSNGIHL